MSSFDLDTIAVETQMLRPLTTAEIGFAFQLAAEAILLIENRLGPADLLDQAALQIVVRRAVCAVLKRPDSATQVDVRIDDGAVSRRYESSSGRIEIGPEDWDLLAPNGNSPDGAFTIRPAFSPGRSPRWAPVLW